MAKDNEYELLKEKVGKVLSDPNGRDVIWHILSLCDIYSDVFTGDSRESYLSGKRSVGLGIIELLNDIDPLIYPRLLLQHNEVQE